jgi:hypothetical protein
MAEEMQALRREHASLQAVLIGRCPAGEDLDEAPHGSGLVDDVEARLHTGQRSGTPDENVITTKWDTLRSECLWEAPLPPPAWTVILDACPGMAGGEHLGIFPVQTLP